VNGIHWGRVLAGGFLAELCVFAIVFPTQAVFGQTAFLASILVASAAMPCLFAMWVTRRVRTNFLLHGVLVGAAAAGFYLILAWGQTEPFLYNVAHGLKILGGGLGGLLASRSRAGLGDEVDPGPFGG
jgi:hypothetical protein